MTKNQQSKPSIMLRIKKFAFWLKVKKYFKKAEVTFPKRLPINRAQFITGITIGFSFIILFLSFFDFSWLNDLLGTKTKKETIQFIGIGIAGLIGLFNVLAILKRVKAQEKIADAQLKNNENQQQIIKAQHDSNEQKAFNDAIINLGSDKESVRLGGIYNLYKMAINKPAEAKNISEILCAHARSTTQKKDYRKKYSKKPSNEIQSLLNILSRKKENPFKEIRLDLSCSYLCGIYLPKAQFQEANLHKSQFQGAYLYKAQFQKAILNQSYLQKANLECAQLQETSLVQSQLQDAYLLKCQLQGAHLQFSQLQGANLTEAQLQGTYLQNAELQEVNLMGGQLQGAESIGVELQGANLKYTRLQGIKSLIEVHKDTVSGYVSIDTRFPPLPTFEERIRKRIGKNTELKTVIFAGGITKEHIEWLKTSSSLSSTIAKGFLRKGWLDDLIKALAPHVGKEPDYTLPKNSGAITGKLTEEMAEEIIKKYNEAMNYKKTK